MFLFYELRILVSNLKLYITHPLLLRLDIFLYFFYHLNYSISKNRHEKSKIFKDSIELTYGETPYRVLHHALSLIPMTSKDRFYDLGCGRGKLVFFVHTHYHISATGIELIPTYIKLANQLVKDLYKGRESGKAKIRFIESDFLKTNFLDGTIIFLTGTCLTEATFKALLKKIDMLQKGSWVITASYPLQSVHFQLKHHLKVFFSWGYGNLYLQQKV